MTGTTTLETTVSADGTAIGWERSGSGPDVLLVHGTTADRTRWAPMLPFLEPEATVHAMDRRGRGASGDGPDYSLAAEAQDVAAVVAAIGGDVTVFGHSHGALVTLEAARISRGIARMVLYEPPMPPIPHPEVIPRLRQMLDQGRREDLLVTMLGEAAGLTDEQLAQTRALPSWPGRVAAAHTVVREMEAVRAYRWEPARFADLAVPTLFLVGGVSPPELVAPARSMAAALPDARVRELVGHGHVAMLTDPRLVVETILGFLRAA